MCFKIALLTLACVGGLTANPVQPKEKRQAGTAGLAKKDNLNPHEAIKAGTKFFQDIYVAMEKPNELQFGHVAESPKDWEQRYEKINLDNLKRQGKVRWGDKNGAYGEHLWDFNHGGQKEGKKAESKQSSEYAPIQLVNNKQATSAFANFPDFGAFDIAQRGKREQGLLGDVEFISDKAKSLILDGKSQRHGGNYRRADDEYRGKREEHKVEGKDLVFENDRGTLFDRKSGIHYELKPIFDF